MRRNWILAASLVLAISLFAGGSAIADEPSPATEGAAPATEGAAPATVQDETCNSGHVCVWTGYNYEGAKGESLCTGGAHPLAGQKYSAKNRCANKAAWLRENGNAITCVNPANNVPQVLFGFNELWIGAEGSRC